MMALLSDAVMILFCDVASGAQEHDDWHTWEHMHERLSIPGFLRGTRWTRRAGEPRYLIVYELADVAMARSPDYLERLNHPTPWTSATMARLRGMSRGFCRVVASAGYGLGRTATSIRLHTGDEAAGAWLAGEIARLASWRGMASAHLFVNAESAPMTREQSIRGRDAGMEWMVLATAYDGDALHHACDQHLDTSVLARHGLTATDRGTYELNFTATATEVARSPANPPLADALRGIEGPRK
jgi:hypothetical protein